MSANTSPITLSPNDKNVTIAGTVDAYGDASTYNFYHTRLATLHAALFGPKSTHFTLENKGTILSSGTANSDFGIVLDTAGTIKNDGLVEAQSGIFIAGPNAAIIDNTSTIIATNSNGPGIYLAGGGVVTNAVTGTLQSAGVAISLKKAGSINNAGTIIGGSTAILAAGATILNSGRIDGQIYEFDGTADITNKKGATIVAADQALSLYQASIDNAGVIKGSAGIFIGEPGGVVRNSSTGLISASGYAALLQGGTLSNAGKIISHASPGAANPIFYSAISASTVTNTKTGTITDTAGIGVNAAVVYNDGRIAAATGIVLLNGGYAYNAAGATINSTVGIESGTLPGQPAAYALVYNYGAILGVSIGVEINGGTFINSGTVLGGVIAEFATIIDTGEITGTDGVALSFASGTLADRLIIDAAAKFAGTVDLNGAVLEIAADRMTVSTITTSEFTDIGALIVASNATVELAGATTSGHIVNHGEIIEAGSDTLTITSLLANTGTVDTTPNGTVNNGYGPFIGIVLTSDATANNSGLLLGGVYASVGSALIINTGTIINKEADLYDYTDGIYLEGGGTIDNAGQITSNWFGVDMKNGGTLTNTGRIGGGRYGAIVANDSLIYNDKSGLISNGSYGVSMSDSTLFNAGTISAAEAIDLSRGSTLINTGTILGSSNPYGSVYIAYGGTVIDTGGLIEGAIEFSEQYPGYSFRLVINANADFQVAQLADGTLEISPLANAVDTIALGDTTNLSDQVFNIGHLTVDSGATLEIAGTYGFNFGPGFIPSFGITNTGLILESAGLSLSLDGSLVGTGTFDLGAGDALTLNGGVGQDQTLVFTGATETLSFGRPGAFAGAIANFQPGDTIDLTDIPVTHIKRDHFANGVLTVVGTAAIYRYAIAGNLSNETFSLFADATGTGITLSSASMKILSPTAGSSATLQNLITTHVPSRKFFSPPIPTIAIHGVLTPQPLPPTLLPAVTLHP